VADNDGVCTRVGEYEYMMDFTRLLAHPDDPQGKKAAILAEAAMTLHRYAQYRQQYAELGGSLEEDLKVRIVWLHPT
jgi:hypothetical protein